MTVSSSFMVPSPVRRYRLPLSVLNASKSTYSNRRLSNGIQRLICLDRLSRKVAHNSGTSVLRWGMTGGADEDHY